MIERIYKRCPIIIIKSEVWTITHCLGLVHETMVSAVCLYIFFLLDMDLRIGIWNISTTNYKCTSFKPVGFTAQTMEFMFMKLVNEESGSVPLSLTAML